MILNICIVHIDWVTLWVGLHLQFLTHIIIWVHLGSISCAGYSYIDSVSREESNHPFSTDLLNETVCFFFPKLTNLVNVGVFSLFKKKISFCWFDIALASILPLC